MTSDQKAVIALINRSTVLLGQLNNQRRANRELERRLAEALTRIAELEGGASADGATLADVSIAA